MSRPGSTLNRELIAAIEAGACVLAPSQRSARWLKLRYANHAIAQGRVAWATPNIQSFNTFVLQLWRSHSHDQERVLSADQCRLVWDRIVADSKWSERLLSPQAAAAGSFRSWERMQAWRIDRDDLAEHAALSDSDEAQALLQWTDRFAALCRERAWLPVQRLPERLLAQRIDARTPVLTLTLDAPPVQHALLHHLADCGTPWDCKWGETQDASVEYGECQVRACESPQAELEGAARWARDRLDAGAKSIAIFIPNLDERAAQARRVFADVFAQTTRTFDLTTQHTDRALQEASFAVASFRALADFPIVRAALDMLQLAVGRTSSTFAGGMLRSPFLAGSAQEAPLRALADARLRGLAREHYDLATLARIANASECAVLARALTEAQALRAAAPTRALPSAMAEHFIALWRALGWPGEPSLQSDEQQIVARLQEALAEFGAVDELLGPLTFATAVREFEQLTRNVSFEPRSVPAPIAILDVDDADGLSFDAAWIAGMDETRWPPPAAPDAFIPFALQARVGMNNATAQLAREGAYRRFANLRRSAATVTFSWARADQGVDILPSPWLRELGAPHETPLANDTTYAARVFLDRPRMQIDVEAAAPALNERHARGGTRIFELQSQCAFRAFAELRLRAQPLEEVAPDVDARERGTLLHAALADVWQILGGSDGLRSRTDEQLDVLARTALAKHAAKFLDGASPHRVRMLQIEQEIAAERIATLLNIDRQRSTFNVVGRPETQESANVGALSFELRLDRLDELLDEAQAGRRVIIDYKTGNNVSDASWLGERPEQPQLPLYAVTHPDNLAAVSFVTLGAKGVGYRGVARDDTVLPGVKAFDSVKLPAPLAGWQGLMSHWRTIIERLANEFASGRADVDPLPNACRYCHLSGVCRVSELREAGIATLDDEEGAET